MDPYQKESPSLYYEDTHAGTEAVEPRVYAPEPIAFS